MILSGPRTWRWGRISGMDKSIDGLERSRSVQKIQHRVNSDEESLLEQMATAKVERWQDAVDEPRP